MTEAYKPTVTETPRPSTINRGDLSAGLNGSRDFNPRQFAARLVLAGAMLGSGKLALDSTPTSGQEPSPAPSFGASFEPTPSVTPDPETGLLPCPTPTPEPSKAPLPSLPPDIGKIPGGEVLFAQGSNSNGETVIVTLAQEVPASVAPASPAASEGPKTALLDCELTPEQFDARYSVDVIINQGFTPLSPEDFMAVIEANDRAFLAWKGYEGEEFDQYLAEDLLYYGKYLNSAINLPQPENAGYDLSKGVTNEVFNARIFGRKNLAIGDLFMSNARALKGLANSEVKYGTKNKKLRDKKFDDQIRDQVKLG